MRECVDGGMRNVGTCGWVLMRRTLDVYRVRELISWYVNDVAL